MKRVKRRYLALRVDSEGAPSQRELMDAIWGSVAKLYGEVGASLTGLVLVDFDVERRLAVVRVSLAAVGLVRASLASVVSVGGRDAAVHVVAVSGTLKALFGMLG